MPLRIAKPTVQRFFLTQTDEHFGITEDPTWVEVRDARNGDQAVIDEIMNPTIEREWTESATKTRQHITLADLPRRMVFAVLCGTNLLDENGKPYFEFDTTVNPPVLKDNAANQMAWNMLPEIPSNEIYTAVLEKNPQWKLGGNS